MQIFVFVSNAATRKDGANKVNQIFMKMFFDADWWRCPPSSRALNCRRGIWCSFTWKISQLILVTRCPAPCRTSCADPILKWHRHKACATGRSYKINKLFHIRELGDANDSRTKKKKQTERKLEWIANKWIYIQFCIWRCPDESKIRNKILAASFAIGKPPRMSWCWALR